MTASPSVSVLLPVYNEAADIDGCLSSLAAQDYDGAIEVVVAEGGSTDDTRQRVEAFRDRLNVALIDNPARVQSNGLNVAAAAATGDILIRADGHTSYEPEYVRKNVEVLLDVDAVAVGGLMAPRGDTRFSRAVAAAMSTPLAIGPGRFHHATTAGATDTVYLGAFRRKDFERLGGYRSFPSQVAEDADLYYRWRAAGETIWLDPSISSAYQPRRTWRGLWRQAYRWGKGKAEMWYTNGALPYLRPLIPAALVIALVAGAVLAALGVWWPLVAVAVAWGSVLIAGGFAAKHPGVTGVAAAMHLGYGLGVIVALVKGRRRSLPMS